METIFGILIIILIFLMFSGAKNLLFSFFKVRSVKRDFWNLTINRKDTVGQIFIFLSIIFFGEALLILNRYLSGNFSVNWIILIVLFISFLLGYILEALYLFIFAILFFPLWWISQSVLWVEKYKINSNVILSGVYFILLIFYLLGRTLENNKKWGKKGKTITFLSIPMLFTFLFVLSTPYGISLIEGDMRTANIFLSLPLTFFFLLFLFTSFTLLIYTSLKNFIYRTIEFIPLFFLLCFFLTFLFSKLPQLTTRTIYGLKSPFVENFTSQGVFFVIFLNILAFSFALLLFFIGYRRKEEISINFGILFMSFFIIFQYFNFFKFANKSLFFLGGGLLLFLVGYFMEKGRKKYIKKIFQK